VTKSMTDQQRVGERLRLARVAVDLTQELAAERVGLSRTTLVAIERGDRVVKPNEMLALAEAYGVSVSGLLRPAAIKVDIVGQFRRSTLVEGRDVEGEQAVQLLHDIAAACVELEHRLGKVTTTNYPPERKLGRGRVAQQAEDAAAELRSRLGLGLSPISDLLGLVELELGVRVFLRPLHSSIAGVYAFHDELGACVVINVKHPWARRRWSLSHELAHFMTTRREPSVTHTNPSSKHPDDVFADAFAAAFLMPSGAVRRVFDEYVGADGRFSARHIILGAHRFGVSLMAFALRLENLDLLPRGTYESLRQQGLNEESVREVLPESARTDGAESSAKLLLLAAEAYEAELYSEGQLADMLVLERVEIRKAIDGFANVGAAAGEDRERDS
jgi:Zn-dependent peptidase ImmA (M78 family)/transcriptional regulator with XRE-family HTH domain